MKLAFSGEARYPNFTDGYRLYSKRVRKGSLVGFSAYCKVVRMYCASLAERLCKDGMVDLPAGLGMITVASFTRKPRYREGKFVGYGMYDWDTKKYNGNPKAFGLVYLPNRNRSENLRCYGFVANRKLYKRMKSMYDNDYKSWTPLEFNDDMI